MSMLCTNKFGNSAQLLVSLEGRNMTLTVVDMEGHMHMKIFLIACHF